MNAPTGKKKKPKPNLVRLALRTATNRPPRSCAHCLDVIAEHADQETGRNAFMSVGTLRKRIRRGERQTRDMMARLRGGGWIAEQIGGPDPHAVAAYLKLYRDPRHRPPVYRVVLLTLACPRGAESAPLTLTIKGCGNGHLRGAETDAQGVRLAATIPSFTTSETSSLRVETDSRRNESLSREANPPSRAGGSGFSDPPSISDPAPTQAELRQTVRAALKILEKPLAIMGTEASYAMIAALEKITSRGRCCLDCALLVPFWVAHGEVRHGNGENLQGMNQRTNLTYLWGSSWGTLMACATQDARSHWVEERGTDGSLSRTDFDEMLADLASTDRTRLYDEAARFPDSEDHETTEAISQAIHAACRWCPKRKHGQSA
jgi:hypothetical protein